MKKIILIVASLLIIGAGAFGMYQNHRLNLAHSTYENYYAFRGCVKQLDKTDSYGTCQLADGLTIKIVAFKGKWYLDGDLPASAASVSNYHHTPG